MTISSLTATVAITLADRAANAAGFGTPAIFCQAPYVGGKLYELSPEGLAAMVTDGFSASSGVYFRGYQLASQMAAQSPHATNVMVYGRTTTYPSLLRLTPLVTAEGAVYNFDVRIGSLVTSISYAVPAAATVATVVTGLHALVNAIVGVTSSDDTTHLSISPTTAGTIVQLKGVAPAYATVLDTSGNLGIENDLAAAVADPDTPEFFDFVIDSYCEAESTAAAIWAEANKRPFYAQTADTTNVADAAGTGIGQDFFTAGYNLSSVWHNGDMPGSCAACVVGRMAAFTPGTSAAHYKSLSSVSPDALSASHLANANGKNINLYALNSGTPHTFFGKMSSGRSIRLQRALLMLEARIKEAILNTFLGAEFIPMNVQGFGKMEAAVRAVLANFRSLGIIEAGFTVSVPTPSSLTASDLANGVLKALTFSCVMAGDMQRVEVSGSVSLV